MESNGSLNCSPAPSSIRNSTLTIPMSEFASQRFIRSFAALTVSLETGAAGSRKADGQVAANLNKTESP
jgi:hypothetical protein